MGPWGKLSIKTIYSIERPSRLYINAFSLSFALVIPESYYVPAQTSSYPAGTPTDPACGAGALAPNSIACNVSTGRLTDGVLGDTTNISFIQFSAWERVPTPTRFYFILETPVFLRQINIYFYRKPLMLGLPYFTVHASTSLNFLDSTFNLIQYSILNNQNISDSDNGVFMIPVLLYDNQFTGLQDSKVIRITFNFSTSKSMQWILLSEVELYNSTGNHICYNYITGSVLLLYCVM